MNATMNLAGVSMDTASPLAMGVLVVTALGAIWCVRKVMSFAR